MSALISGILSQHATAHSLMNAQSAMAQATTASNSASDSANISANDFLTLLVTEMKNQDPTANTDPNEYINQLVQVNSLEQLISINQTLTSDTAASRGIVRDPSLAELSSGPDSVQPSYPVAPRSATQQGIAGSKLPDAFGGNLAVPPRSPAAIRVAQSLTLSSNSR
jgi:flagellar basal-body rod modification protein FlgD